MHAKICNQSSCLSHPSYLNHSRPSPAALHHRRHIITLIRCSSYQPPPKTLASSNPQPVLESLKAFAPATVANLGPGFDFLGCAVDGLGDTVTVRIDPTVSPGTVSISSIDGIGSASKKLSCNPLWNCAGIAAIAVMRMIGVRSVGISLSLDKGLPLGSGLGSSAASAAAAAAGVNALFGMPLSERDLVLAGLESEAKVSGHHADNIAPAIMGGFVLIRSYHPLDVMPLRFPADRDLFFVLVSPEFEAPTKKMRAALPQAGGDEGPCCQLQPSRHAGCCCAPGGCEDAWGCAIVGRDC
ncbi:homoserine kinase [Cinnamomum micranthum f. kanehirae]|uniref:Homoserine kinase n=1 Tax=Cinnamomum micranthum f. kanehirae TaxID=337451 RepID=A0A3S3N0Y1_9MAGN|nr:homoserine kinase [Cinnamomum micranthum f. kanehirae]